MLYIWSMILCFPLFPEGIPVPWKTHSPEGTSSEGICAMSAKREVAHQRKMQYYFFINMKI